MLSGEKSRAVRCAYEMFLAVRFFEAAHVTMPPECACPGLEPWAPWPVAYTADDSTRSGPALRKMGET
jgi:hypothetical protein